MAGFFMRGRMAGMNTMLGIGFILSGVFLIAMRDWSADSHERLNQRFWWTRWATGPVAMRASRIANVVIGIAIIAIGMALIAVSLGLAVFPSS